MQGVRETDTAARLSGDEFVVIIEELDTAEEASAVAAKLGAALRVPISVANGDLAVTCSMGVAYYVGEAPRRTKCSRGRRHRRTTSMKSSSHGGDDRIIVRETAMNTPSPLLSPDQPAVLLVDPQPGLAFAVQSIDRQALTNNLQALAKVAHAFALPLIVSTSATKVYSGPVMTALRNVLPPDTPVVDRRSMNAWEDASAREAVVKTGRKRLLIAGLLTEACVSFPALDALAEGCEVFVVADACGGATTASHDLALERLRDRGTQPTSWLLDAPSGGDQLQLFDLDSDRGRSGDLCACSRPGQRGGERGEHDLCGEAEHGCFQEWRSRTVSPAPGHRASTVDGWPRLAIWPG
jgi:nicotinamidase-related amidase